MTLIVRAFQTIESEERNGLLSAGNDASDYLSETNDNPTFRSPCA